MELHYKGVDWKEVVDRLYAYTAKLFRVAAFVDRPVTGKSPEDFVNDALKRLWDQRDTGVEWDSKRGKPSTDSVFNFLAKVIKRDFIDAKTLPRHTRTEALDDVSSGGEHRARPTRATHGAATARTDIAVDRIDWKRRCDALLAFVADDEEVTAYLRLQLSDDGYHGFSPQRAADLLNTDVDDINNRKKRCQRYLKDFVAQHAKEAETA